MITFEERVSIFDSKYDRSLLLSEAKLDPAFGRRIEKTLALPDGEMRVAMSARRAFVNELDPRLYPESKGTWKALRSLTPSLMKSAMKVIESGDPKALAGLGDLGQWDIIGQIAGAVVQAGASV